jgi:hypothetical protein
MFMMAMQRTRLITLGVATAVALIAGSAGAAGADPTNAPNTFPIQAACDNGHTYSTVLNANASRFSPALDINSTAVLVVVAFETVFTVTDPDGNVVESETFLVSKGSSAQNQPATTNCSIFGSVTGPDGFTFTLTGTATYLATPSG